MNDFELQQSEERQEQAFREHLMYTAYEAVCSAMNWDIEYQVFVSLLEANDTLLRVGRIMGLDDAKSVLRNEVF